MTTANLIGRAPERLTLTEHRALIGKWIAIELYDPHTLPLRVISAVGTDARDCIRQLEASGKNPAHFEYLPVQPPFAS